MSSELERVERVLADALTSTDPVAQLERAARDPALSETTRRALASASPDGVRISALLIIRLRFERALQGSRVAGEWFGRDPHAFTAAFKRYHTEVAPTSVLATDEGRAFEAWLAHVELFDASENSKFAGVTRGARREEERHG